MSGDYSRKRFNPGKHYLGVLRQQGRVDLDADWNEYVDLQDRRWRAGTVDLIGRCGVSSETPEGFKIQGPLADLVVGQGRIYVDGLVAENHGVNPQFDSTLEENYGAAPTPVNGQPYGTGTVEVPEGRLLVYLDVWRREVTHLQEPQLVESALNVDTTTRYQTAWQVKVLGIGADVTCETELVDIEDFAPSAARLTTTTVAVTIDTDPCLVPPTGGYRGLENHLYRVEVHSASATEAAIKWSRENAHVSTNVLQILSGLGAVRVVSVGRDEVLRFKAGDWVEITKDPWEFEGRAGIMRKVLAVDDTGQTVTFTEALPASDFQVGAVAALEHWRLIRWDQFGSVLRPDGTELINLDTSSDGLITLTSDEPSVVLENGIQVTLSMTGAGTAHAGDYWCFAARTAEADVERLDQAPPHGIHHHFCKLAIVEPDGTIQDCRPRFPALTELVSLFYVSGDGQEAAPGQPLAKPIQVGVANGRQPVAGASVRFRITSGGGSLTTETLSGRDLVLTTGPQGVASCDWTLDMTDLSQQVEAQLQDGSHLPVRFNATPSQAGGIDPGIHVQRILIGDTTLHNDSEVVVPQLVDGIRLVCDRKPSPASVKDKPVCWITLDIPFPYNSVDQALWGTDVIGFQPIVLAADVETDTQAISWRPKLETIDWLRSRLFQKLPQVDRVLARLTLKGNYVWDEETPGICLDGDVFGMQTSGSSNTAIRFPSGDGRRGGDLEMWFWLAAVRVTIQPPLARLALGEAVEFTVTVEGAANKAVDMSRVPPDAGSLVRSSTRENVWTYTAPRVEGVVSITATSLADQNRLDTAKVFIREPGQIAIFIEVPKSELAVNEEMDVTVTVEGGDVSKVQMSVNGILNGGPRVGTIQHQFGKGPGVWVYTAPGKVPLEKVVTITATSEDTTKSAEAKVTITETSPKGPAGSVNPATGVAGGKGGKRTRRSPPGPGGSSPS